MLISFKTYNGIFESWFQKVKIFCEKFWGVTSWYQSTNLRELGIRKNVLDSNSRLLKDFFKVFSLKLLFKVFSKLPKASSGNS